MGHNGFKLSFTHGIILMHWMLFMPGCCSDCMYFYSQSKANHGDDGFSLKHHMLKHWLPAIFVYIEDTTSNPK